MNAGTAFVAHMRLQTASEWAAVLSHRFLLGMSDGTLPSASFRVYMVQDYLFLIEYARVFALATAKAESLEDMERLAELAHATLSVEMELHRGFASRVGISGEELENAQMLPRCHAYTRHLLSVAWAEPLEVIAASLLPCQLGYAEIAATLAVKGMPGVADYAEWVTAYTSDEYVRLARWLAERADGLAEQAGPRVRKRMEAVYRDSLRLEHGFWDMAFDGVAA